MLNQAFLFCYINPTDSLVKSVPCLNTSCLPFVVTFDISRRWHRYSCFTDYFGRETLGGNLTNAEVEQETIKRKNRGDHLLRVKVKKTRVISERDPAHSRSTLPRQIRALVSNMAVLAGFAKDVYIDRFDVEAAEQKAAKLFEQIVVEFASGHGIDSNEVEEWLEHLVGVLYLDLGVGGVALLFNWRAEMVNHVKMVRLRLRLRLTFLKVNV